MKPYAPMLMVLMLDGWVESVGVQAEIKIAKELGIPVQYIPWRAITGGHEKESSV